MKETSAFRTLLIAQWIIPIVSAAFELWLAPPIHEVLFTTETPLFEETYWIAPSWMVWLGVPELIMLRH